MNSVPDLQSNLQQAERLLREAADGGARLAVLPEAFPFLGPEDQLQTIAPAIEQDSQRLMQRLAEELDIYIAGGIYAHSGDGRLHNRLSLYGPAGAMAHYDKLHLFDVELPDGVGAYRESRNIAAGRRTTLHQLPGLAQCGFSICYDLRFPELYRALSAAGAEVLLIPSAFTAYTGAAHWELLIRARAIENLCFVVAPAQCGLHYGERRSFGHSLIVDPWGVILAEGGTQQQALLADLEDRSLSEARQRLPALQHRRTIPMP
ncbi:MAG: carbon-nitrogen hydrolase family protein [Leptospirales bacterium]|nr:carbon-nitrogen hydrolase family protein [Leptospirales bacterium]